MNYALEKKQHTKEAEGFMRGEFTAEKDEQHYSPSGEAFVTMPDRVKEQLYKAGLRKSSS